MDAPARIVPPPYELRAPVAADKAYVCATMTRALADTRRLHGDLGRAGQLVDRILDDSRSRLLVASELGGQQRILGWTLYADKPARPRIVHFVYSRRKGMGVGTALLRAIGVTPYDTVIATCPAPMRDWLDRRAAKVVNLDIEREFLP